MTNLYRKKPVEFECWQWNGELSAAREDWVNDAVHYDARCSDLIVSTNAGDIKLRIGDWIIKGNLGEVYSCTKEIFDHIYEKVPNF